MEYLSLVISTYNRSNQLLELLRCFDHDVIFPRDFKIQVLVVDNKSTDSTKSQIRSLLREPRPYQLSYTVECKSGLSNARNRGILESKYKRICFLDDDTLLDKNFFNVLKSAFNYHRNILCFSLRVKNHHKNKPEWYCTKGKYHMLDRGNYDLGEESRFLTKEDPIPIGSGMIIDKSIFEKLGMFDTRFGYDAQKSLLIPGEETELFLKIIEEGIPIYYIHNALVYHYPDKSKYEIKTLCKTYRGIGFWYGKKDAENYNLKKTITWFGFPRSYYKRFMIILISFITSRLLVNVTVRNYYHFQLEKLFGQLKGYREFRVF